MRGPLLALATVLLGCQPPPAGEPWPDCPPPRPEPGEVVIAELLCEAQHIPDGEGRAGDLWVANHWLRMVVRHPVASLTLPGVGGGTVVDAAPWEHRDGLHELVPLVEEGWLLVDDWQVEPDGLWLAGRVASLPDRPATAPGSPREVRVSLDPDGPWIRFEGAQGMWLHGARTARVFDGQLFSPTVLHAHEGTAVEDLGGALRIHGTDRLLVAPIEEGLGLLPGPSRHLAGEAPGAGHLLMLRGGAVVGRVPLGDDGAFDLQVPADIDGVRATAGGRAPSPVVAPGDDLLLEIGPPGALDLALDWPEDALPRPVRLRWEGLDGHAGSALLPAEGGVVETGAGDLALLLEAGPSFTPRAHTLTVPEDGTATLATDLRPRFSPGSRVLVRLDWPTDRSRTWRGTGTASLRAAAASGHGLVVLAPEDIVAARVAPQAPPELLRWRHGVQTTGPGWRIVSWPWSGDARAAGLGAPAAQQLDPEEALTMAWGGPGVRRFTAVDLGWLTQARSPHAVSPHPQMVFLPPPQGDPASAWAPWLAWLDAGVPLAPVGPHTWVTVDDAAAFSAVDVEAGLIWGQTVAGTGPVVELWVDDAAPGEIASPQDGATISVSVRVQAEPGTLDRLRLLGDGGELLAEVAVEPGAWHELELDGDPAWVLAVADAADGPAWAATGPVWRRPPGHPVR